MRQLEGAFIQTAAALCLLIVPLTALASNYAYNNRSRYYVAHDFVENIFRSIEPRGMLLTSNWQAYSPSLYVNHIEQERKDIIVLDTNLMKRSWYYQYLDQAYPEMTAKARPQINLLLEDIAAFDRDPEAYQKNPVLNERINRHFNDVLTAVISGQIKDAPVYVTPELTDLNSEPDLDTLIKSLGEQYEGVPQGLVFTVGERSAAGTLQEPAIEIRGLNDGTLKFEKDDVVSRSVMPAYLMMLTNTGKYLSIKGLQQRAARQYNLALKIDPAYEPAKKGLAELQKRP
jgi:hypothetical protein